jgi:cytochrome P450/NADPH-cytochrome P450 reductase
MNKPIPHLPRLPIIGNLHQIAGKDIVGRLLNATQDFKPVSELVVFGFRIFVITEVALAKEVLDDEDFDKFINLPIRHLRKAAGDGLFTAWTEEPNWQKAHNVLLPGFAHKAIQSYIPIMQDTIDQLIDKWKNKKGDWIDVAEDMTRLTFETIGLCGFDYSFDSFENEDQHPFVEAMLFTFNEAIQLARTPTFLHPLRVRRNRKFKYYLNYMNNLLDEIIKKRRASMHEHQDKIDFLQLMLHSKDKATGEYLTDENIRHQIVTFLVAGHETTGSLLAFAIYNLLKNPDTLAKAYAEVDQVLGQDKERPISQKDFKDLKYLRQVLMEALRMYPPVPFLSRYAKEDRAVGGYPVKANQSILLIVYHLHRDPNYWGENVEAFDPERFSAEAVAARDRDAFLAFGYGQRSCIGRHFAMLEASLALAKILQHFEMELEDGYELQFLESPAMKPKGMKIRLKERGGSSI